MTQANFKFISDASGGDQFTVVSFSGTEAISSLYEYQIEIKAPLSTVISLDDVLDSPARFITDLDGKEYPVYGMLSNFEELQTVQDTVHFKAILVPRLWGLSIYKTNEIYTQEKTVDLILETVLENAGLYSGTDYDMNGLAKGHLLSRDYVCQFGESDFDFISRLMENEGIFYYFDQSGDAEKIIFINDMNYEEINRPALIYDVMPSTSRQFDCIDAWICRKQRLAGGVTVRDFNPDHPSMDIAGTTTIDQMSRGTDYFYGENIQDTDEAAYLSEIRAEESLCKKTRYYGEGSVTRLQAGYLFEMGMHPNENYNGIEYLAIEVNHEGLHLDMQMSSGSGQAQPQYRNSFVAIEAAEQFRPARVTPKPRFYGTMTAFIYAEGEVDNIAQIDKEGRYRVHMPFDRADGTKDSTDPHRKASTWIRMAQPFVGQEQGMYFPMKGGTEVLLTFINGDPDQPVISAALPNCSQPSLLTSERNFVQNVTSDAALMVSGNTHTISMNSAALKANSGSISANSDDITENSDDISDNSNDIADLQEVLDGALNPTLGLEKINEGEFADNAISSMLPPWSIPTTDTDNYVASKCFNASLIDFKKYNTDFTTAEMDGDDLSDVSTDRCGGDNYVYANARTFAYPQHERVYFIGTFHEDFHVKDDFTDETRSWTRQKEVFHFPAPGGDGNQFQPTGPDTERCKTESEINPEGIRGVSEDKRWGDQMNYAWGRIFNWGGGQELGDGGAGGEYNYGNAYTENLLEVTGYTLSELLYDDNMSIDDILGDDIKHKFNEYKDHKNDWTEFEGDRTEYLKDCKSLQADTLAAEKTFGNTYSYQMGYAVDIHEGHSLSKTYGDTDEYIDGNTKSFTQGTTDATYWGEIHEYTMAGKAEFNLAACSNISLAENFELYGGLRQEIALSGDLAIQLGLVIELFLGSKFEFHFGLTPNFSLTATPLFGDVNLSPGFEYAPLITDLTEAKVKSPKVEIDGPKVKTPVVEVSSKTEIK